MKVELIETGEDLALHAGHGELWVKAVSEDPLGPDDWSRVLVHIPLGDRAEILSKYRDTPCEFFVDTWEHADEPGREDLGFEQWWIFPAKPNFH